MLEKIETERNVRLDRDRDRGSKENKGVREKQQMMKQRKKYEINEEEANNGGINNKGINNKETQAQTTNKNIDAARKEGDKGDYVGKLPETLTDKGLNKTETNTDGGQNKGEINLLLFERNEKTGVRTRVNTPEKTEIRNSAAQTKLMWPGYGGVQTVRADRLPKGLH